MVSTHVGLLSPVSSAILLPASQPFSGALILLHVKGPQTGLAYSSTGRTNAFECCIFQPLIYGLDGLDVAPEEAQGLVGFVADINCVNVPSGVRGDINSKVFCLRFCAQSVTVELVTVL